MNRKHPKSTSEIVTNAVPINQDDSYIIYGDSPSDHIKASETLSRTINACTGVVHAHSRMGFDPTNVGGINISGRSEMTMEGYEAWRPSEKSRSTDIKWIIIQSDLCYKRHGLIRNIIDLMGDFASQGIRLVHPNKRIEKFYQNWFGKVGGPERSERFLNNLYRLGNVVIRYQTAKINVAIEQRLQKTSATPDMDVTQIKVSRKEIPWKYVFLHPATIDVIGGALANFVGDPHYAIQLPMSLAKIIKAPKNEIEKSLVANLPNEIREAALSHKAIPLPKDKTRVFSYKKDDWQAWGDPMISSILIDISLYEKMKLADRAALDGAISNIRIFKLGSLEHKIIPGEAAATKLASILEANTEAGTLDLIWGPDIELIESKTNVHEFLGVGKYEPTLIAIYAGLGIPPTLTGTFGAAGTTNNYISLKTLTQRLEYGRDLLVQFWNEQIRVVQEAMGFRFPAKVEFDMMNLGDEAAEKALLIQLADRNLISDELLQRHFAHDPDMERIRINKENNDRENGRMVPKAGAFHDPMFEQALVKVFAQTGVITPSQAGVELKPNKRGEKPALEMKQPAVSIGNPPGKKPSNTPNQPPGRPRNSKDTVVRKEKTFRPKVKATVLAIWAYAAQEDIAKHLNSMLLQRFQKSSFRELTAQETEQVEKLKFGVLCNLEPFSVVTDKTIFNALGSCASSDFIFTYKQWYSQISTTLDRNLNLDERKRIQAAVYAAYKGEEE